MGVRVSIGLGMSVSEGAEIWQWNVRDESRCVCREGGVVGGYIK
jgi:hypothetical protein